MRSGGWRVAAVRRCCGRGHLMNTPGASVAGCCVAREAASGRGTRVPQGITKLCELSIEELLEGGVQSVGRGRGAVPEDQHVGRQLGGRMSASLRAFHGADRSFDRDRVLVERRQLPRTPVVEQGFCQAHREAY